MTEITPRFFVLPLIALAVIVSLPRPAALGCAVQASPAAGVARLDNAATDCASPHQQVVINPMRAPVR